MRSLPSAARRRLVVGLVGVLTLGVLALPLDDARADRHGNGGSDGLQQRRHAVRGQVSSAAADLDEASHAFVRATRGAQVARTRLTEARAHLADVSTRLTTARTAATGLQAALATSRQQLATATASRQAGQLAVDDQRGRVRASVVGVLTEGDPSLRALGSLMDAGSVDDVTRTLSAQGIITSKDDDVYGDLSAAEADLATRQHQVAVATADVATRSRAAADELADVRDLYTQAQEAKRAVAAQVASSVAAKQRALAVRRHDRGALARLRTREARIHRQILALARREAQQRGGYTGASTGFLTYPATGYPVTSPYGYRIHPIFGYYSLHDGDDFGVPCGTQLHAAAAGTVISSYDDAVWGNRIFLSLGRVNGHNMTVIYNHLSKPLSHVGEHVARGQVVGLSGTTGWSTGCHLHFTVMVDGTAVDPMKYL